MEEFSVKQLLDLENLPGAETGEEMVVYEKLELVDVESHPADRKPDLEEDYALARKTAHYMNQMIMDMAQIALHNAKNSESPRHVEVFTTLMNQLNNSNQGLMKIHKEMREITEEKTTTTPLPEQKDKGVNIENATVFVGSPTELMAMKGSSYDAKDAIAGECEEV
ncbi:terminase small subunit [Klebsiella phage Miro]|uniref:Terminase small subunit n=1 Tax=Klebsiella phage Miro TaxID=1675608 RepID=A0A0K1LQR3_9CAUD|nr:terminase small subunit [Klebsiella phage Miro]AKU44794.1 terminase small subunit [Klebsiella phage Miro]QYC51053.1 terminase small subunit [Klebsiella phage vB_KpnM-VAC66]UJP30358.1 terminase small subunit [Raoultella phage Rpl1]